MRRRWSSPRFRRRMMWVAAVGAAATGFVVLGIVMGNTSDFPKQNLRDEPVQTSVIPTTVHLSSHERDQLLATSTRFVRTAVVRRHLTEAYDLVGPELRGGMSRK